MDRPSLVDRVVVGVSASVLVGAVIASEAPALGASAQGPGARADAVAADPVVARPGPVGLSSPWLDYAITMPGGWAFAGHVAPGDSQTPHDIFTGVVPGSRVRATVVIGRHEAAGPEIMAPVVDTVAADGAVFTIAEPAQGEAGRRTYVATAVHEGTSWYITASGGDDAAFATFFRGLLASFRFSGGHEDPGASQ